MTKISRNLWILDRVTFLTVVARISQSCGQETSRPPSPPGTWLYSQHRQINCGSFEGQWHIQMWPKVRILSSWLLALLKSLQLPGSASIHISAWLPGPPFPARLLSCSFLPQSLCATKPTLHASYYLHIFAHTASCCSGCPTPSTLSQFYISSRKSIFLLL